MNALPTQTKIMIGEVVVLFIIPFLPNSVLSLTDNLIVRFILMAIVLASSLFGPYVLLLTFIVVLSIFGLRNQIKVKTIIPPSMNTIAEVEYSSPEVVINQPPSEVPNQESYNFEPQEDSGRNDFQPVDESINEKIVMNSAIPDGKSGGIFPNPA